MGKFQNNVLHSMKVGVGGATCREEGDHDRTTVLELPSTHWGGAYAKSEWSQSSRKVMVLFKVRNYALSVL